MCDRDNKKERGGEKVKGKKEKRKEEGGCVCAGVPYPHSSITAK